MERESFEDAETAALMNERFVCVKVDREERPDVDALYMEAVQAMTGHGGWPLNVFLTPEQVPFYGGTYFPPERAPRGCRAGARCWARSPRRGTPSARRSARRASRWRRGWPAARCSRPPSEPLDGRRARRRRRRRCARASTASTAAGAARRSSRRPRSSSSCSRAASSRWRCRRCARWPAAGIFDQVGGGFSRYSVDARWTVPHFEKMLYDNALLARAYLHGFQASGDALLRRTAEETLDWALREMRAPEGGFYSALDADSEGVEGKFYVWTLDELRAALGDDADAAIAWFGATERGNFEGAERPRVARARAARRAARRGSARALLDVRAQRVRPGLDDKRLAAWNALMIAALADAGAVLGRDDYLDAARGAAAFVLDAHARRPTAACCAPSTPATARLGAYLEDHAFLLEALLVALRGDLRGALVRRGARAGRHDRRALRRPRARRLLLDRRRPRGAHRPAQGPRGRADPVGRLERRAGPAAPRRAHRRARLRGAGAGPARAAARGRRRATRRAFGHLLQALDLYLAPRREVALAGDPAGVAALAAVVREARRPHLVLAGRAGRRPTAVALMEQPHARRRPRRGLRVRALRLPHPGHRARRAARPARGVAASSIHVRTDGMQPPVGVVSLGLSRWVAASLNCSSRESHTGDPPNDGGPVQCSRACLKASPRD